MEIDMQFVNECAVYIESACFYSTLQIRCLHS